MLEKGFLKNKPDRKMSHSKMTSIISNTMLYTGVVILISAFVYLLFNFGKSEMLIGIVMPILVCGLGLILVSQLIKRASTKLRG